MDLLYFLESIRCPFLDAFFSVITYLGSETVFIAAAIIVYWCVGKKNGYYLMTVGFFGTIVSQFMKLVCRIPRPWVRDPKFTVVESAIPEADGYSFPSGHAQSSASVLGSAARFTKKWSFRIICIVLILLTALSRMYLGVHTPEDVLVGMAIGLVFVFALYPIFERCEKKPIYMYVTFAVMILVSLGYVLFVEFNAWPADVNIENLESGVKNGYLILGCSIAILISSIIERKYINFEVKAPWWAQLIKIVVGLGIALVLKAVLKEVFYGIFDGHMIANAFRYFFIVIFAVCVWPLTFKWFSKGCPLKRNKQ